MSVINIFFRRTVPFLLAVFMILPAAAWKTSEGQVPLQTAVNTRIAVKSAAPAAAVPVSAAAQASGSNAGAEPDGQNTKDACACARIPARASFRSSSAVSEASLVVAASTGARTAAGSGHSYDATVAAIRAFLREMDNGIKNMRVYLQDVAENRREFYAEYDDNQGNHHLWRSGVFYDTQTQMIYGADEKGALSLGFDLDHRQMTLYAAKNTWQRDFGFNAFYDLLAPAVGDYYQTMRVMFRYAGMDWMVQFWKGQYAVTVGGEFGIYNKPLDRPNGFYDSASDEWLMPMSMKLYCCDKLLFERPLQPHWWMTGFKGGVCLPSMLRLEGSIEFPSAEMEDSFIYALANGSYSGFEYAAEGDTVRFAWQ
ncbi:MAG: hypothetical protein BWY37_01251 [Firmicutes bacterium ADurb.Bin262]|nr:MAG: hypothetical protein BWY37_01251 [Firmicutes bacterium ADurb.Bin262]